MSRRFSPPGSWRETVLFGGPDPNGSSMHESAKGAKPLMVNEQPTISAPSDSGRFAKDSAPIRLHTVRIWFPHNGVQLMEDIKRKGLEDVVFDAIALQGIGAQHQAQDDHGIRHEAFLVDLAVLEVGISRVLGKYGITKFVPLSGDDPIILQQPVEDLDSKKALCYQHLHSKFLQEYAKRCKLGKVLGYEIHEVLKDWYKERLEDICNRFKKLGYC
ncbi:hypothetical protein PENNAL_c0159G03384 [Penicillium nalgiovense]|uniref:Uncharacterized protein n=1 Tax=Penicillium nalgiovense TaxID=60175 RepID=A0A1V6WZ10_PENNA|nr:hypothetical protein PENNAL_c0159G03384 [Penicillium nalgiovense]